MTITSRFLQVNLHSSIDFFPPPAPPASLRPDTCSGSSSCTSSCSRPTNELPTAQATSRRQPRDRSRQLALLIFYSHGLGLQYCRAVPDRPYLSPKPLHQGHINIL